MFAFSNSPAALGAVAAFFSVVALAADRPDPCVSDPKTHADYGLNAEGAWCTWDDIRTWKAAGVGCKLDSECSKSMFPYTNGLDDVGTESDVILNMGTPFCHWFNETSGPTECFVGLGIPRPHAGDPDEKPGLPKVVADLGAACRELYTKRDFTDILYVDGCFVGDATDWGIQCMFACNGGTSCPAEDTDPKEVHKLFDRDPCPGYPDATLP